MYHSNMEAISTMNLLDDHKGASNDVVAEAIAVTKRATELRDAAIAQLLAQREQIDRDLQTLGHVASTAPNGSGGKHSVIAAPSANTPQDLRARTTKFRNLTLAQIGRRLLEEHGTLHGREIERLAKAGGFKGGTKNFQNYMPVAFKRDGGFENTGGNTWRLKQPEAQEK
jgi:hypothetical protein